jgi:outer membrane protein TolC
MIFVKNYPATYLLLFLLISLANSLTLKKAQEYLLARNLEKAAANMELCKKSYEEAEAKAIWYPSIDIVGSYNYFSEKNSVALLGRKEVLGTNYRTEAGIDISWPITQAFVNIYNVRYRHFALMAKEAQNKSLKNLLSFKLGTMFFLWNLSYNQLEVHNTLIEQLEDLLKQTQNKYNAGFCSISKLLEVKARVASAKTDLISAKSLCDSIRFEIQNFLQCTDSSFIPEEYSFNLDSMQLASLDTISINNTRAELTSLEYLEDQLKVFHKIISGQKYPSLVAYGGYRYANPGLNMGDSTFMGYAIAGIMLKWNIFDGFKVSSQHKQTKQQQEIIKIQKKQMIDSWNNAINNAKMQIKRAQSQLDAAKTSCEAAEAVLTDAKNNFSSGTATQTDVLNALSARAMALLSVKKAEFMMNMAILQLYYASGKDIEF